MPEIKIIVVAFAKHRQIQFKSVTISKLIENQK